MITRSLVQANDDDWTLDDAAFNMDTTDRRRLSRVPIEHLAVAAPKTKFLLLISVDDDEKLFKRKGERVDMMQNLPRTKISSREFYTLKCEINDSRFRLLLLHGNKSKQYDNK